jgi:hypothetical protein
VYRSRESDGWYMSPYQTNGSKNRKKMATAFEKFLVRLHNLKKIYKKRN